MKNLSSWLCSLMSHDRSNYFPLDAVIDVEDNLFDERPLEANAAAQAELDKFRAHMETKVAAWELLNEAPHADVWHEGMPFNNETQDNLLQQIACDMAGRTQIMKQQMPATVLDAKDLPNIRACSVFLQLGLGILYKLCTNGDNSSLFLEPGIDVTNQMFVQIKSTWSSLLF